MSCNDVKQAYSVVPKDEHGKKVSVAEGSSCTITFYLEDPISGAKINKSQIQNATMSLFGPDKSTLADPGTGTISDVDAVPFFDADGNFSYALQGDYNIIVGTDSQVKYEYHYMYFDIQLRTGGVDHRQKFNYLIKVENNPIIS